MLAGKIDVPNGYKRRRVDDGEGMASVQASGVEVASPSFKKVLKSCSRCRSNKVRCDAMDMRPSPCTHCLKKGLECVLEVVHTPPKRSTDVVESLTSEVQELKKVLDSLISRKSEMIEMLIKRGVEFSTEIQYGHMERNDESKEHEEYEEYEESEESEESENESEESENECKGQEEEFSDENSEPEDFAFSSKITATTIIQPLTPNTNSSCSEGETSIQESSLFTLSHGNFVISMDEAERQFANYRSNFHRFIPILPHEFLHDLQQVYQESDLLFWSIVCVSYLNGGPEACEKYQQLSASIKSLVVAKCWYNTPRSVHTLLALSILTTWPLPEDPDSEDQLSIKYLALMNNLALQLGLHRSEFINEFSHKTVVGISKYSSDNNKALRERIYKYVHINSSCWYTMLGLPQRDEDYMVNKKNIKTKKDDNSTQLKEENSTDLELVYITSLLSLSLIQSKISTTFQSSDTSITRLYQINKTKRFLNLGMFEKILQQLAHSSSPLMKHHQHANLMSMSVSYIKLQTYLFTFFPLDKYKTDMNLTGEEYKSYTVKALQCCYEIIQLFEKEFCTISNFAQVPVHYRFMLELSMLILMRIHHSPLLDSVASYRDLKRNFQQGFEILTKVCDDSWKDVSVNDINRTKTTLLAFDKLFVNGDGAKVFQHSTISHDINEQGNSFFLIKQFQDRLVSSLEHEMMWLVNQSEDKTREKKEKESITIDWSGLNVKERVQREISDYLGCSIFE
ncbi:hypothetical protein CAAN1_03S07492 [[Candida] anglica]|uniref:Zn(2)-C6 fungal-type domain-containing protein n=1 Tax=[Candida] anglica TaxID=148631 RepID=A0ABP0EHT4_9ASCO